MASSDYARDRIIGYRNSFERFAASCLYIRDHDSKQILQFKFNHPQVILDKIIEKQRADKGYVRILLDKARRFGGSTHIEGRGYWLTSLWFNRNAFVLAHEEDSTDTLFGMARLFHERNPIAPQTRYSSKKELLFDNKMGTGLKSEYGLACARNTSAGRSQGLHFLHVSELAYFPDNADELLDGLLSCLPADPKGTEVYLESTGNGFGNRFQRDCYDSYAEGRYPYYQEDGITYAWSRPGSDWVLVLIPWFAADKYTRPFETEAQREAFKVKIGRKVFRKDLMSWEDSDETKLMARIPGLTLEQLHWRAWTIENTFKGRVEKFRQEFPSTVEESFLATGSNVFSADLCDLLDANCKAPLLCGEVVERAGAPKIRPGNDGAFRLFGKPDHDDVYFLTVDTAGGIPKGAEKKQKDPDPSCVDVWDHETGEQMAQWHGHIDYDLIGELVQRIGGLFTHHDVDRGGSVVVSLPIACVERNNHGHTAIADLKRVSYPLFEHKPDQPGWDTNAATKPKMVDSLANQARDGGLQIRCRETVAEMRTFTEKGGHFNAESGCHDERVVTAAMASQMLNLLPRYQKPGKKDAVQFTNWSARRNKTQDDRSYTEVKI
jgi:hypothetical protein